jgi:hypothetical protein
VACFAARGSAHACVCVDHGESELVIFDWEITIPDGDRPPTVALYEDREMDATPTLLQVCTGEAADLIRQLANTLSPRRITTRTPVFGAMTVFTVIANWVS